MIVDHECVAFDLRDVVCGHREEAGGVEEVENLKSV